jgi:CheY-like chemotaxis protein
MFGPQHPLSDAPTPSLWHKKRWEPSRLALQYTQIPASADCILIRDINMPMFDGLQVAERLQLLQPTLVVIDVRSQPLRETQTRTSREGSELRWLRENQEEVTRYRGQWLLISTDGLLEHSASFREIKDSINRLGIESPFVYYVPTEVESSFVML